MAAEINNLDTDLQMLVHENYNKFICATDTIKRYLMKVQVTQKEGIVQEYTLQAALDASKQVVIQGSMNVLLEFRQLLGENPDLLLKLRGLTVDWVQEGFQNFFRKSDNYFFLLSGKRTEASQDVNPI